jgi:hypothetical protein
VADLAAASAHVALQQVTRAVVTERASDSVAQRRYGFQPAAQPQIVVIARAGRVDLASGQGELRLRVQNAMPWAVTLVVDIDGADAKSAPARRGGPARRARADPGGAAARRRAAGLRHAGRADPRPSSCRGRRLLVATTVDRRARSHGRSARRAALGARAAGRAVPAARASWPWWRARPRLRAAYDRHRRPPRPGHARAAWPEKIADDAALARRRAGARLSPRFGHGDVDRYDGRLDVRLEKTGWFHTQKAKGRWCWSRRMATASSRWA